MRVTLNDEPVEVSQHDFRTVSDLLDGLKSTGRIPGDHMVASLTVDNQSWEAQEMEGARSTPLASARQVAIQTEDMNGCARRIVADSANMLAALQDGTRQVARSFRENDTGLANAHLFRLLDALHCFLACLYRVQNVCELQPKPLDASKAPVQGLSDSLQRVQECQEKEDWVALAARLEGDLLPALGNFTTALESMRKQL